MSVRHQVRAFIEELFNSLKDKIEKESIVYAVYAKEEILDEDDIDILELNVDKDSEDSVKKFLDRLTRESLEGQVKGISLKALVFEKDNVLNFISKENVDDIKPFIEKKVELLKEE